MKQIDRRKGKGLIRGMSRKGTVYDKTPAVGRKGPQYKEPSVCERCGAVYMRQKWRRAGKVTGDVLEAASWVVCPACRETASGVGYGRILITGEFARDHADVIRRRIANVERRATFTQPERRVLSVAPEGSALEVVTTSQKLAHRIARELEKAFGGRARYNWSDEDGSLLATWHQEARAR